MNEQRFQDLKRRYPDTVLLFRSEYGFEAHGKDRQTLRDVFSYPSEGFAAQALHSVITKLLRAGFKVGVCDSLTDGEERKPLTQWEGLTLSDDEPTDYEEPATAEPNKPAPDLEKYGLANTAEHWEDHIAHGFRLRPTAREEQISLF